MPDNNLHADHADLLPDLHLVRVQEVPGVQLSVGQGEVDKEHGGVAGEVAD
jgi:hypothetical protein